jgi:uncharacterized membrane protein YbjE (DUF340 family)
MQLPENVFVLFNDLTFWVLLSLLLLVGIGLGAGTQLMAEVRLAGWKLLLFPLIPVLGTLLGTLVFCWCFAQNANKEYFAVSMGLGYYSLSCAMITAQSGALWGAMAVMVNVLRELLTLAFSRQLSFVFGPWAPVASGGATSMDTTLPVIVRASGDNLALPSVFSGVLLTILVPFLISLVFYLG